MLKKIFTFMCLVLLVNACDWNQSFNLEEPFKLKYQQTKINTVEDLEVTFDKVVSDSRCPEEMMCVWAGNAEVQLTFQAGDQKETFILNTGADPKAKTLFGYTVSLTDLSPANSVNNPPAQRDYIATVIISKVIECSDNSECVSESSTDKYYCQKEDGMCQGPGQCVKVPNNDCPDVYAPVCGCDGTTYGNECEAAAKGVNVASEGECCGPVACTLYCRYGFKKDENGCEICECLDINYCSSDFDCACGVDRIVGDCAMGNLMYIDTTKQCPDFCNGIGGDLGMACVDNQCTQVMLPKEDF